MARAMYDPVLGDDRVPRVQVNRPAELSPANSGTLARFLMQSGTTLFRDGLADNRGGIARMDRLIVVSVKDDGGD